MEYVNDKWSASSRWIRELRDRDADQVVSHFCAGGAGGIAYLGAVCGGYWGVNINEHIRWPGRAELVTGRTFAHELGHNLGMEHDFAQKHGGNNRPGSGGRCEGKGLMSYGSCNPRCHDSRMPDAWSTCSISDFEALFKQSAHKCLAKKGGATGTGVSGTGATWTTLRSAPTLTGATLGPHGAGRANPATTQDQVPCKSLWLLLALSKIQQLPSA